MILLYFINFSLMLIFRIQAAWRGYLVRKWYKTYRKSVPPNNPILRKKYFQEKLTNITNRIVQSFNHDETRAENLIQSIDENILKSREAFKKFDEQFKMRRKLAH